MSLEELRTTTKILSQDFCCSDQDSATRAVATVPTCLPSYFSFVCFCDRNLNQHFIPSVTCIEGPLLWRVWRDPGSIETKNTYSASLVRDGPKLKKYFAAWYQIYIKSYLPSSEASYVRLSTIPWFA
jgi:hypothetical protein